MALEDEMNKAGQEFPVLERTELGEAFKNLDDDVQDDVGLSKIDFNTRLTPDEIKCIVVIDELTRIGILPDDIGITRTLKRLSVSRDGQGRAEKVKIASAGIESGRAGGGFLKGLFRRGE